MRRIELKEYETHSANVRLEKDQIRALTDVAHVVVTPSPEVAGSYKLTPSSHIGAVNVGDLTVVIRPKIPIDRVMFLIAYAMDPKNWWRDPFEFARDDDVLEAIALAFAHRTRQAIQRGLLQGYRREEDALHTVRGRVRFGDQISRRFGIPLPIEVAFDEFTEDIEKNRLLKTAIHRLGHTFIRSPATRQELRALRPAFAMVGLGSYRPGRSAGGPVQPARRALPAGSGAGPPHNREHSSLELFQGKVVGAAFLIDMNKVFEQFLYVALGGEALGLPGRQWKHEQSLTLDEAGRISMKPDLSWWPSGTAGNGSQPIFVADAKYKKLEQRGFEHADIYQMLAYCTGGRSVLRPAGLRRRGRIIRPQDQARRQDDRGRLARPRRHAGRHPRRGPPAG